MAAPAEPSIVADSQRRFARNVRWQLVANASQALLGGAYLITLGRFLGPTEFGIFSSVTAIVSVVGLLLEMRLQEVVARDFCHLDGNAPGKPEQALYLLDLFVLEALSRIVPATALVLLASWLAQGIALPSGSAALLVLAAVGFVLSKSGSSVANGLLRVLGRTDLIAAGMAADWGLRLLATAVAALTWVLDVSLALWIALVVGALCNAALVWLACRGFAARAKQPPPGGWTLRGALSRLRAARRLIASNLGVSGSDLMAKDLDVALISGLLPADKVGLYKMAKSFVQVLWRAVDPFYLAIMPEVQKLWQRGERAGLARMLRKTSIQLLLLSIALAAIGTGAVALIGERLLGSGYAEVPALMLAMSPWLMVCAPLIWGIPLAVAINRPELSVGGSLLGLAVGLAAFALLTPMWGLVGAAIAWNATLVTGFLFTTGAAVWVARHRRPAGES